MRASVFATLLGNTLVLAAIGASILSVVLAYATRLHPSAAVRVSARAAAMGYALARRRGGVLTAVVLVFVETMKEMPATLLLRPLGFNTLAVAVWERTSESLWADAAAPALAIVAAGLVPVLLVVRLSAKRS